MANIKEEGNAKIKADAEERKKDRMIRKITTLKLPVTVLAKLEASTNDVSKVFGTPPKLTPKDESSSPKDASPSTSKVSSAAASVYNTTELFEKILIQLTRSELYTVAQRVSHRCKEVIGASPVLQAKLGFHVNDTQTRIQPAPPSYAVAETTFHEPNIPGAGENIVVSSLPLYYSQFQLNPCLRWMFHKVAKERYELELYELERMLKDKKGSIVHIAKRTDSDNYNIMGIIPPGCPLRESRDSMFLTHPPVTTAMMYVPPLETGSIYPQRVILTAPGGVTFGLAKAELNKVKQETSQLPQTPIPAFVAGYCLFCSRFAFGSQGRPIFFCNDCDHGA